MYFASLEDLDWYRLRASGVYGNLPFLRRSFSFFVTIVIYIFIIQYAGFCVQAFKNFSGLRRWISMAGGAGDPQLHLYPSMAKSLGSATRPTPHYFCYTSCWKSYTNLPGRKPLTRPRHTHVQHLSLKPLHGANNRQTVNFFLLAFKTMDPIIGTDCGLIS